MVVLGRTKGLHTSGAIWSQPAPLAGLKEILGVLIVGPPWMGLCHKPARGLCNWHIARIKAGRIEGIAGNCCQTLPRG